MKAISTPDDWYGRGTAAMRAIAKRVAQIRWYAETPYGASRAQVAGLARRHLDLLESLNRDDARPHSADISVFKGPWRALHKDRWGTDPYDPWGARWENADASVTRSVQALRQAVESSAEARALIGEPLWPLAPHTNICGGAFIVDIGGGRGAQVHGFLANERDRNVAWALLCRAESHVWEALLWELAFGAGAVSGANPFEPIIALYELGFFPMGWVDDCYELYVPALSAEEARWFATPLKDRGANCFSWR